MRRQRKSAGALEPVSIHVRVSDLGVFGVRDTEHVDEELEDLALELGGGLVRQTLSRSLRGKC